MRTRRGSLYGGGLLALSLMVGVPGAEASVIRSDEVGAITEILKSRGGAAVSPRIDLSSLGVRMSTDRRPGATTFTDPPIPLRTGNDPFRTFVSEQIAVNGRFGWSFALMSRSFERRTQTPSFGTSPQR